MKRLFLPLALLSLIFSTSCNNDVEKTSFEDGSSVMFNAKFGKTTRATDFDFESEDRISVYASYTTSTEIGDFARNVEYEFTNGLFETNENLKYPDSGADLQFLAIYPYTASGYSTPDFNFAISTDQRNHSDYTQSDLMTASAVGNKSETVDLTFNHRLAKIVINIAAGNMPAGEQMLTLKNVKHIANADLTNNTFYADNSMTADVIASTNGSNSFKVILPPQSIAEGSIFAEITIGSNVYMWTLNKDLIFNSGVEYTFNLNLDQMNEGDVPSTDKEWQPIGKVQYTEDMVTTFFSVNSVTYEVEAEQSTANPSMIRLVNPYGAAYTYNDSVDYDATTDHYMVFNCEDPDAVFMDGFHYSGMDWGYGEFIFGSIAYYYMEQGHSFEDVKSAGYCGTLDENLCITFPAKTMIISMSDYNNGELYFSNTNGYFKIDLSTTTIAE